MITLGEQAEIALRVVEEAPLMAYDTETSGTDWKIHNPVGYVITTRDFNIYVPIRHRPGGNLLGCKPMTSPRDKIEIHPWERALAKAFLVRRERGLLTVGHHIKFDMHMSANAGIMIGRNCGDTQLNMAMLDEYSRSFSLATAASVEKTTAKKGEDLYRHMSEALDIPLTAREADIMEHYWRMPGDDPMVAEYAMGDGITTLEVWNSQCKQIRLEEMETIHRIESRLVWTFFRMERRGIKVDERYIESLAKAVEQEVEQALLRLPANFNVRSPTAMRQLFEEKGITNWPVTVPLGNPSFNEKFLKQSQPGRDVIAVRQLRNLNSSFVEPLRTEHMFKGRVHTNINQLKSDEYGTVGGRISTDHPNLLAVPKRNKEIGPRFRRVFVADNGMEFWEADYKQIEPVLFAHYSKDETLLAGYRASPPIDCHQSLATRMGVERDPTAKRMNMGIFTGMQKKTFAMHMGWPLDKAAAAWDEWFSIFPGVRDFQDNAKRVFQQTGYVVTMLGRRCHLEHPRFAYRGTSRVIQGSNADIMKAKILEVDEWLESEGDKAHLLLSIYDSLEWQAPKGKVGEAISQHIVALCTNLQVEPFNLRCPLGMDVGHGKSWAEATYGPEAASA